MGALNLSVVGLECFRPHALKTKTSSVVVLYFGRTLVSPPGGYREASASIRGDDVYGSLKYENGVHRVSDR